MARPKSNRPTEELHWRIPTDLIEWGQAKAEAKGMAPGEWLTWILDQVRAGGAVKPSTVEEARPREPQVTTRFKAGKT